MKYLIIGHPRSGTRYMYKLFKAVGILVRHEKMGRDGTSNWQVSFYNEFCARKGIEPIKFDKVVHVVRNPIKVVESTYFTENVPVSTRHRERYLPQLKKIREVDRDMLAYSIVSVVEWNRKIRTDVKVDIVMQVENADKVICEFTNREFCGPKPSKKTNGRRHGSLDLQKHKLFNYLKEYAGEYGYAI